MRNWFKRIFGKEDKPKKTEASLPVARITPPVQPPVSQNPEYVVNDQLDITITAPPRPSRPHSDEESHAYLLKLQEKVASLAGRFSKGEINRKQFEELYNYYQTDIVTIEQYLAYASSETDWRQSISDGESIIIRRRHVAQVIGYSIYENLSGLPVKTGGEFGIDPDLFVPMLHAYQSASREIFGGGFRSTEIEGGRWLCFIPGRYTTTIGLFSTELSGKQLKNLQELHRIFEEANLNRLAISPIEAEKLVCLHDYYLTHPL